MINKKDVKVGDEVWGWNGIYKPPFKGKITSIMGNGDWYKIEGKPLEVYLFQDLYLNRNALMHDIYVDGEILKGYLNELEEQEELEELEE